MEGHVQFCEHYKYLKSLKRMADRKEKITAQNFDQTSLLK